MLTLQVPSPPAMLDKQLGTDTVARSVALASGLVQTLPDIWTLSAVKEGGRRAFADAAAWLREVTARWAEALVGPRPQHFSSAYSRRVPEPTHGLYAARAC